MAISTIAAVGRNVHFWAIVAKRFFRAASAIASHLLPTGRSQIHPSCASQISGSLCPAGDRPVRFRAGKQTGQKRPKSDGPPRSLLAQKRTISHVRVVIKRAIFLASICLFAASALAACSNHEFQDIPDGNTSVKVDLNFGSDQWMVTVKNKFGSASDAMFAVNDRQRSNIYLTPSSQLVVVEKGGEAVFFRVPTNSPPVALNGPQSKFRDQKSNSWEYVGVIERGVLTHDAECIPLMGEGKSPYRKRFQSQHSC